MATFGAWILPGLVILFYKKIGMGVGLLILQLTLVGWVPASLIALRILKREKQERLKNKIVLKALRQKSFFFKHWTNRDHQFRSRKIT